MKRGKAEIIWDILEVCRDGATIKTTIVHKANLNFKTISPYISLLEDKGLIVINEGRITTYEITDKGINILKNHEKIKRDLFDI
jgi:predicted transcriptional regulator